MWSGPIIVALCANNLRAVRESINGTVVFCCDNDQWKPEVGNVGIEKARAAMKPGDELNWPVFAENERKSPTDFNDLLMISNLEELSRQFHSLQSLECTFYHDNSFQ